MTKVIIGAGISGLYTAIKLRQAKIHDVVVYDPRAGHYTRPGHLNLNVFRQAEAGTGIDAWPETKTGHIKDLERALYKKAKELGIKIENKRFIRLHEDEKKPGVVVTDDFGSEEIVEGEYVFDCTGGRREVVSAVNRLIPESPLQLKTITDLPVRNHFIAYVKISNVDWGQFERAEMLISGLPEIVGALEYARSIIKLRALGWNELKYPRVYGQQFGKEKVCVYLHAPEHLNRERYEQWVQTALECYTSPIHFAQLPASFPPKPRFMAFTSDAQALEQVSYKGRNLPIVTALGDAQIDFDYALAHGILDGMRRIDSLIEHMNIIEGKIWYFDSQDYTLDLNEQVTTHKRAVANAAERLKGSFAQALESAPLKFRRAIALTTDASEKSLMQDVLIEIEARLSYIKARQLFSECHSLAHQIRPTALDADTIDGTVRQLNRVQVELLRAYADLPKASFAKEHGDTEQLLAHLAMSWKEVGNALFRRKDNIAAMKAYQNTLYIYSLSGFSGKSLLKELPLYSNLIIAYCNEKHYSEAISLARIAVSIYEQLPESERPSSLYEKIVFNYIRAMCIQALSMHDERKIEEAQLLRDQVVHLMESHKQDLSEQNAANIKILIDRLQSKFPEIPDVTVTLERGERRSSSDADLGELQPGKKTCTEVDVEMPPVPVASSGPTSVSEVGMFKAPRPNSSQKKLPPPEQCCSMM